MINRLLTLVLFGILSTACIAEDSALLLKEAEQALQSGDLEGALTKYMRVIEQNPENADALEWVASIATEMDMPELAIEVWIQRADLAVIQSDPKTTVRVNAEITRNHSLIPESIREKSAQAARYDDVYTEVIEVRELMAAEAQTALDSGDYDGAISALESALFVVRETFGDSHWLTVTSNRDLGDLYQLLGVAEEAEKFYGDAVLGAELVLGEVHPDTLEIKSRLAELYVKVGFFEEAHFMRQAISSGYESSLGAGHVRTIQARWYEIGSLKLSQKLELAMEETLGLCATLELGYGTYHPETIGCHRSIAEQQAVVGDLEAAQNTFNQVTTRMNVSLPGINADVLNVLTSLAEIYRIRGEYQASKELLSSVIQTSMQIGEIDTGYIARLSLGRVLNDEGDFANAQSITETVLDYGIRAWMDDQARIYNTLLELGSIYQRQSKLAAAEAVFEEALQGLTEIYGSNDPATLVASSNLGQIYEMGGLYDRAEPLIKETLMRMEEILGPDHPTTMKTRNNLGVLHESQGNFREAEPLYLKSINLLTTVYGADYTDTIAVKNNLAYLYMLEEEFEKSARMFEEVQQQWTTIFGEGHQNSLKAANNLGRIYQKLGQLPAAEQQIQRALKLRQSILGPNHIDTIRSMIDLGGLYIDQKRTEEAQNLLRRTLKLAESELGELHPYTFDALNYLAQSLEADGQLQAAADLMETGFGRRSQFFDTMLWTTGENARSGYIRIHKPEFNRYLSLLARMNDSHSAKRLINASLQRKGLLLKITSEIQQIATMTSDPELGALALELETARKRLAAMTLSGPTVETKDRHTEILYELERKVMELQGQLGRASVRYRTSIANVNADRLQAALPEGASLIDFLVFEDRGREKMLAAVISKRNGDVTYKLIEYADRKRVDDMVVEYRTIIQDDLADEDEILESGLDAYELVWGPLEKAVQGSEHVYLIPDGLLNILPFNALVDADENYLIQVHDLHTLTSGRDLLPNDYSLASGDYLVFAGPDYDSKAVSDVEMAVAQGRRSAALKLGIRGAGSGLRGLSFSPLPGAEAEGRIIVDRVKESNVGSREYFGANAQEVVLVNMAHPPEILHIATHGFFLEADDTLRKRILKAQRSTEVHVPAPGDNPLLRSGLAFAGINTNAKFLGDIETNNDGVLTALEVLDLNLSGTRLVVLSACETGLGEIHEGEGVYGLRRSFQEAGVAEVISSLWEVSDAGTQALMTGFYDELLAGVPAREALRKVQLSLIDSPEWGYPYIWSAFMIVGSYESSGIKVQ